MTEKIDMISKTDYAFENVEALGFEPRSKGLFHVSLFQSLIIYSDDL